VTTRDDADVRALRRFLRDRRWVGERNSADSGQRARGMASPRHDDARV